MNWDFKHRPDRQYRYETYMPHQPRGGLDFNAVYAWLWTTYGQPGSAEGTGQWDSHSRWIKLKSEQELTMFLLQWS
jgi:hypothetical protein